MLRSPNSRPLLAAALAYAGGSHTVDDVVTQAERGQVQIWEGPNSVVVTEIDEFPREKVLHFFLAAGDLRELAAMQDGLLAWGAARGCTKARLVGRRGWQRTFLARTGWHDTRHIIMERDINGTRRKVLTEAVGNEHAVRATGAGCGDPAED